MTGDRILIKPKFPYYSIITFVFSILNMYEIIQNITLLYHLIGNGQESDCLLNEGTYNQLFSCCELKF